MKRLTAARGSSLPRAAVAASEGTYNRLWPLPIISIVTYSFIGSGPAGQRAAIQGAKLDKRVAIIERKTVVGGVSVNLGTIPSKTLREAVLDLSGYREREFYGAAYRVKQDITMQDLLLRTNKVIQHEIDVTRHQLMRNGVELIGASAAFCGPDTVRLDFVDGSTSRTLRAQDRYRHRHRGDARPAHSL